MPLTSWQTRLLSCWSHCDNLDGHTHQHTRFRFRRPRQIGIPGASTYSGLGKCVLGQYGLAKYRGGYSRAGRSAEHYREMRGEVEDRRKIKRGQMRSEVLALADPRRNGTRWLALLGWVCCEGTAWGWAEVETKEAKAIRPRERDVGGWPSDARWTGAMPRFFLDGSAGWLFPCS